MGRCGLRDGYDTVNNIEQSKLTISEIRNRSKWINWLLRYRNKVEGYVNLSPEERRDLLGAIFDKIIVDYDPIAKRHSLRLQFQLPLVRDYIEHEDEHKKGQHKVVDGKRELVVPVLKDRFTDYSTVTDFARLRG
jgi:hypothetical protein